MRSLLFLALFAACGSKTSAPAAPTPDPNPDQAHDQGGHDHPTPATTPDAGVAMPAPDAAPVDQKAVLLAAEMAAYENAKPVFDKYCAKCHVQGGAKASKSKLKHFNMTTYPFTGHHAHEMGKEMREVLAIGGGKPTMPADHKGAVKGDELALIAAWADAFDAAHAGGAHEAKAGEGQHKH